MNLKNMLWKNTVTMLVPGFGAVAPHLPAVVDPRLEVIDPPRLVDQIRLQATVPRARKVFLGVRSLELRDGPKVAYPLQVLLSGCRDDGEHFREHGLDCSLYCAQNHLSKLREV